MKDHAEIGFIGEQIVQVAVYSGWHMPGPLGFDSFLGYFSEMNQPAQWVKDKTDFIAVKKGIIEAIEFVQVKTTCMNQKRDRIAFVLGDNRQDANKKLNDYHRMWRLIRSIGDQTGVLMAFSFFVVSRSQIKGHIIDPHIHVIKISPQWFIDRESVEVKGNGVVIADLAGIGAEQHMLSRRGEYLLNDLQHECVSKTDGNEDPSQGRLYQ